MPRIRVTTEILEYMLDLPEGAKIAGCHNITVVEGVPCISFNLEADIPGLRGDHLFALQYEAGEDNVPRLVAAIPVPE